MYAMVCYSNDRLYKKENSFKHFLGMYLISFHKVKLLLKYPSIFAVYKVLQFFLIPFALS
jgi:hypothetical protein